jgi:hypothetical protein
MVLQNLGLKKNICNIIIFLLLFIVFTFSSFIIFSFSCGKYYCYYKNCYKNDYMEQLKCFVKKTNSIDKLLLLDLVAIIYIFIIYCITFIFRITCKDICKRIKKRNNNNFLLSQEKTKLLNKISEEEEI